MPVLEPIELRLAILERSTSGVLVVRFKPDTDLDQAGVAEVLEARLHASGAEGAAVLVVLHEENLSDMKVHVTDHGERVAKATIAEAIVAPSNALVRLSELYYSFHVQPFPTAIFPNEAEATEWLERHIPDQVKA